MSQLKSGFYTEIEKTLQDMRFDNYAYSRKRRIFFIWELEINNTLEGCIRNVRKVDKVLKYKSYPYVHMFHIFSPFCEYAMEPCEKAAKKLQRKNEIRFTYRQFKLTISFDEFEKIYESFRKNKGRAEQKYGRRLRIHIGKIIRRSIEMFTGK